jgi:pantoate--beta-alanine ligase
MQFGARQMSIEVIRSTRDIRDLSRHIKAQGRSVALVPTMGGLHDGHLSLVQRGFEAADEVIPTIFVNAKQFGANEDFGRYPRNEDADIERLSGTSVKFVYAPSHEDMYEPRFSTAIVMAGPAKAGLEDKFRPQFFDGVATVVAKLFIRCEPDFAIFGEKDYQQLQVVKQMARDLDLPVEVVGHPTRREDDGLAMSTRNRYLSKHERHQATALIKTLEQAAEKIRNGVDQQTATKAAQRSLLTLGFKVDYVTARNAETLNVPVDRSEPLRLLVAAHLGTTRLIDNIPV